MAKLKGNLLGAWAFLIGVILAVIIGLFGNFGSGLLVWALIIIGLIVGLFNIAAKEAHGFMTAGTVLVIVSYMGQTTLNVIPQVGNILGALLILFVPATIIVALRAVFSIAKR